MNNNSTNINSTCYKKTGQTKKRLIIACMLLIVIIAAVYLIALKNDNMVTHSIETIIETEKDDYTHEILYAYIKNNRIYLEMFFYKTDNGMTFDPQFTFPLANPYNSPVDYQLYYNGKRLGKYSRVYGSSIGLSYEMPAVKKGKTVTVSLYSGEDFLADIELYPTDSASFTERPIATVNDITLTADVQRQDNQLRVRIIDTALPKDAIPNQYQHSPGFSACDIHIQDAVGNVYKDKYTDFYDESGNYIGPVNGDLHGYSESLHMHALYNVFYFDIPNDLKDFKIIIPMVIYTSKRGLPIEREGYWKINVSSSNIIE